MAKTGKQMLTQNIFYVFIRFISLIPKLAGPLEATTIILQEDYIKLKMVEKIGNGFFWVLILYLILILRMKIWVGLLLVVAVEMMERLVSIKQIIWGRSWTEQFFLKKFSTFTSVFAVNQKIAWVTGWLGKIYYTENGGESWYLQNTNIKNCLSSIYFTSEKIGWAVGHNGIILKSVTGGITTVKNQEHTSIQKFHLLQNYPNPFNPTTSLQYHLQQNGQVKLVIYNQNGQLVQTLVDEFQSTGSH